MSSSATATESSVAATSSEATGSFSAGGSNLKIVGIILAVVSGLLIGSSFVFKKKGLLKSQAGGPAGEGVGYLKSPLWWLGMSMMILGELCNFAAYAFVEAIVVTPLGALSVVVCAILSSIFLKETLTLFGWLGCGLCILGSVVIALNGPSEETVGEIRKFEKLFVAPGFLSYAGVVFLVSLTIIFYFGPKYGKQSMLWYIMVCSMIGGISVSVTTGLGAAIVSTAQGNNQFDYWFMYFLLAFVIITLLTEVYYLNVALALFNTAMVTPTYYVIFTFFSIITTIILFRGLSASPKEIITLVMGFLTICVGITILQLSKVDPVELKGNAMLDRRSTLLLQAARAKTEDTDPEKGPTGLEDPGMDALRGSFGAFGSIIRARSVRNSIASRKSGGTFQGRPPGAAAPYDPSAPWGAPITSSPSSSHFMGLKRHQLYDAPMPGSIAPSDAGATRGDDSSWISESARDSVIQNTKKPTIKFDDTDVVHKYHPTGQGSSGQREDAEAIHAHRSAVGSPSNIGYPPTSSRQLSVDGSESELLDNRYRDPFLTPRSTLNTTGDYVHPQRGGPPHRGDSKAVFEEQNRDSLLSFPSVTDSGRSWDGTVVPEVPSSASTTSDDSERGRKSNRSYPRGAREDDRDESVGLVARRSTDDEYDEPPSIRLVQKSR